MASDPRPARAYDFTAAARRRKLVILALLVLLLAAAGYVAWFWANNRKMPTFVAPSAAPQVDPPTFQYAFGYRAGTDKLTKPTGIAVGRDGRTYVVDPADFSVRVFTREGTYVRTFEAVVDGKRTKMAGPVHLAIAPDGNIWVADRRAKAVYVFTPDGRFVKRFEPEGKAAYPWVPLAITIAPNGDIYVTDVAATDRHQVLAFRPDGARILRFGSTAQIEKNGEQPGKFFFPDGIVLGKDGRIYVSDGNNRRVQVFTSKGVFEKFLATSGVPRGLAVDAQGRIYIVNALAHSVDVYNEKGDKLVAFGENGVLDGQFRFPNDVAVDPGTGRIFVTDRENDRVQVWGWPVGQIPARILPRNPLTWLWCLIPLLLVPLLLWLRRRKTYVILPDAIAALEAAGTIEVLTHPRSRFVIPEADEARYAGRVVDGVTLSEVLHPEPYSSSDAAALATRLEITEAEAAPLAMAQRVKRLVTEDARYTRMARLLGVDVDDAASIGARLARRGGQR